MDQQQLDNSSVYESLFKNSCSIMLIIDPLSGSILDANDTALKFYQYSEKEIKDLSISQINTLPAEKIKQEMSTAQNREQNTFRFCHRLKNGEIKHVEVFSGPIIFKNKNVLYSIIHDISEQVEAAQTLAESENTIRAMINATSNLLFLFDTSGRIIKLNKPGAALFGRKPSEMTGEHFSIFFKENEYSKLRLIVSEVVRKHVPVRYQTEQNEKFYEASFHPVFNKVGKVDRICAFVNDITELKMTEKVFTAIETAGGVCHEMNQPLQVMFGNLELLKMNTSADDPNLKFIKIIQAQAEKLGLITKKLTHITHYETKKYVQGTIFDIDRSSNLNTDRS